MKLSILHNCNIGDHQTAELRKYFDNIELHPTANRENVFDLIQHSDAIVIDPAVITINQDFLEKVPESLKFISLNKTGFDNIDLGLAREKGIVIANVPSYSTESVAELNIAFMFALSHKIILADKLFREDLEEVDIGSSKAHRLLGFDLRNKTIGIIGLGSIGARTAELAVGMGMKVIGYNRSPKEIPGVRMVGLEELLALSDVISINIALVKETENFINQERLNQTKDGVLIINTARGRIVNSEDLAEAIRSGKVGGAGLDVIYPTTRDNPLFRLDNVILTPHLGYNSQESNDNMGNIITDNLIRFAQNQPINSIN